MSEFAGIGIIVLIWVVAEIINKLHNDSCATEDINCPVCGYYCLGEGGIGCVNKLEKWNRRFPEQPK